MSFVLWNVRNVESKLKPFAPLFQHCVSSGQTSDGQSQSFFRRNHFVPTKDLFSNYIFFDIAQDTLKIGITDSHNFFVLSTNNYPLSSLLLIHCLVYPFSGFLSSSYNTSKATLKTANIVRTLFQNGVLPCALISRVGLEPGTDYQAT